MQAQRNGVFAPPAAQSEGFEALGEFLRRKRGTGERVHDHLPFGQPHLEQEMTGERNARGLQPRRLGQLEPDQRQAHGNAAARRQHHGDIAVLGRVVVVDVAAKTHFAKEEMVEHLEPLQRGMHADQMARQPHLHLVDVRENGLDIEFGEFVLRNADCRLHQRQMLVALHQGGKVLQGRRRIKTQ